ncbi:AGE family epimerase/isomerase [Arhodomonas sp. AD133]|uniref:AGE family epimerase/isomerase n=1 Tax=Arhodomonas sp. AD133 TaxID=3415009 RepID=UPI003EBD40A4
MNAFPDWYSKDFLRGHVAQTMAFYHPRCLDHGRGGFYQHFRDDGSIYDADTRHLVSSTRFVFNYAMAWRHFGEPAYREAARHGLRFLREAHRNPETGGYAWVLGGGDAVLDGTNHCYGLAFVVLAYATAVSAGLDEARPWLEETWALLERWYWEPQAGLYLDERSADLGEASGYRGQNANMHACEAMIAAWQATGEARYLDRAVTLARRVSVDLAGHGDGLIWEHYDRNWRIDWDYNRDDPSHLFRPWGFQTGHQTEWAKLLASLYRYAPEAWMLERAEALFAAGMRHGWDAEHGGLVYGFDPQYRVCDGDKYFWVQAESLAAAARLAELTGDTTYWRDYERLWAYAWAHFIDHDHGGWYRILDAANRRYDDKKSPAGKTDYHTMGACYEVMGVLDRISA